MPGWSLIALSFGFPLLLLWLREQRGMGWLKKANPIIACYVVGIILANTGLVGRAPPGPWIRFRPPRSPYRYRFSCFP